MRACLALAVLLGFAFAPAFADDDPALAQVMQDRALADKVVATAATGGLTGLAPLAGAMKTALDRAVTRLQGHGTLYVLADGRMEALMAMLLASAQEKKSPKPQAVDAVASPYPTIAYYLTAFDAETHAFDDAVAIADEGLALTVLPDTLTGEHAPLLVIEKGSALQALHRSADALADYDRGLKIGDLPLKLKAVMERGRGFSLTELGRLDEAQAAYNDSLKDDPGNPIALSELGYIAKLKAGGKTAPVELQQTQVRPANGAPPKP